MELLNVMDKIDFIFDWVAPDDAKGEELRQTWAKLSMRVGEHVVTLIHEKHQQTVNDHVYMPLYPVAEWLMFNCWYVFHEKYTPGKYEEKVYDSRHNLKYAQEGYALPDVQFRPLGDVVKVSWKPLDYKFRNSEFIGQKTAYVKSDQFKDSVIQFIQKVVMRLEDKNIKETLLQYEWDEYLSLDKEEISFCAAAAAIGIDPFNISSAKADTIINSFTSLPQSVVNDFFSITKDKTIGVDVEMTMNAVSKQRGTSFKLNKLRKVRDRVISRHRFSYLPWENGYNAARELRRALSLNGHAIATNNDLKNALGVSSKQMSNLIGKSALPDTVNALAGSNSKNSLSIVLNAADGVSDRFTVCRALFGYFFEESFEPTLVTKTKTTVQKTSRAFAAEFIIPANTLRKEIKRSTLTRADVQQIATTFNISSYIVEYQVRNHQIANVESDW